MIANTMQKLDHMSHERPRPAARYAAAFHTRYGNRTSWGRYPLIAAAVALSASTPAPAGGLDTAPRMIPTAPPRMLTASPKLVTQARLAG
jgi:hypothetical protein